MRNKLIAVSVTIDNKKLTIEGPEDFVRAEVQRLTSSLASGTQEAKLSTAGQPSTSVPSPGRLHEREIVREKKPKGHSEIVAVLAFCLTQSGKSEFTEDDMKRAYIRAEIRPPKVVGQAIRDAKNAHDYIESGKKKGTYRLSHHGDRTVRFDLPRDKK